MNKLTGLAVKFEEQLRATAARGKSKTSRKQVLKNIDKSKAVYQLERKREKSLKKQLAKVESDLEACRTKVRDSRKEMLRLKRVLSNMDLADCNYVVLYDNGDCGYIIDGDEYSLDVNDDGELDMLDMKEYRRKKREEERATHDEESEEGDAQLIYFEYESEKDESEGAEVEEGDDENDSEDGPILPNFRLLD